MSIAQQSFRALGSTAIVAVTAPDALPLARARVDAVIAAFDTACSRFRADSEITLLARAGGAPTVVSEVLFDAVSAGVRAAQVTDGDVDPTLGGVIRALGYDRDYDALAERGPARVRMALVPGWRTVGLDARRRTVRVPPGVELDLGATAKALAADRAAAAAHGACGCGVLVSLGGDVAVAGPAPAVGWRVRVTDDHRSDVTAPGQWIAISTGALATSSTQVRRWSTDAGPAHHLLNPHTGHPAVSRWRTVSVCAASCVDANTASTAAIVRGAPAEGWLAELGLPSRLVTGEGQVRHVAGWPSEGEDLAVAPSPVAAGVPS
jgi:thiamine biosynthesis lipoprotein